MAVRMVMGRRRAPAGVPRPVAGLAIAAALLLLTCAPSTTRAAQQQHRVHGTVSARTGRIGAAGPPAVHTSHTVDSSLLPQDSCRTPDVAVRPHGASVWRSVLSCIPVPVPRAHQAAAWVNSSDLLGFVLFGGFVYSYTETAGAQNDTWIWRQDDRVWVPVPVPDGGVSPGRLFGHSGVAVHPTPTSATSAAPAANGGAPRELQPDCLFSIFGGITTHDGYVQLDPLQVNSNVWVFDCTLKEWGLVHALNAGPEPRATHAAVAVANPLPEWVVAAAKRQNLASPQWAMVVTHGIGSNTSSLDDTWMFVGTASYPVAGNRGVWLPLSTATRPSARAGLSSTVHNTTMFLTSGCRQLAVVIEHSPINMCATSDSARNDVWALDLATEGAQWQALAPSVTPGPSVTAASLVFHDNGLLLYGGAEKYGYGVFSSELWRFDLASKAWGVAVASRGDFPEPYARAGHFAAVTEADDLVVFGGTNNFVYLNDIWAYSVDARAWYKEPPAHPGTRNDHTVVAHGRAFYLLFGFGQAGPLDEVWRWDLDTLVWARVTARGAAPQARFSHASLLWGDSLIVYGGHAARGYLDDMWALDLTKKPITRPVWTPMAYNRTYGPVPFARTGHSLLLAQLVEPGRGVGAEPHMIMYGGSNTTALDPRVWLFNLVTRRWRTQNVTADSTYGLPAPRYGHAATLLEQVAGKPVMVVFGGWTVPGKHVILYTTTWGLDLGSWTWVPFQTDRIPDRRAFAATAALSAKRFVMTGGAGLFTDLWIGGFNSTGWFSWEELRVASDRPADGSAAAVLSGCSLDGMPLVAVLGGSDNTDSSYMSTRSIALGCNAGSSSADIAGVACAPCPLGSFSPAAGNTCTGCPEGSWTLVEGAVDVAACSVCQPGACSSLGTSSCRLNKDRTAHCTCRFGFSGPGCQDKWLFIAAAATGGLMLAAVLGVVSLRLLRRRKFKYRLLENRLAATEREVEELSRWEISVKDIRILERVDTGYEGSFGDVWLASWGDRTVALKKLKAVVRELPGVIEEFQREVRFLACLRHPNIVFFYGAGTWVGTPFLLTEYMAKGSLRRILDDHSFPIDYHTMVRYALDAANGMQFLHSLQPIRIHRDIKASNLLVSENGTVKVGDFGTARIVTQLTGKAPNGDGIETEPAVAADSTLTTFIGTIPWIAPEIFTGQPYDEKVDVYSFGIVIWELVTRELPWAGLDRFKLRAAVLDGQRPHLPDHLSGNFQAFVKACWHMNPTRRPSFSVICSVLESFR